MDELPPADDFAAQRERMVREQIAGRGIHDAAILDAMRTVPREWFVPDAHRRLAYEDSPLPIAKKQTISQPYVVAYMMSFLDLKPADRVLEVGTGSGYAAALLSRVAAEVYTIERHRALANYARERLVTGGYANVFVRQGDGTKGWPEKAPFDAIIVAAGGPYVPGALQAQLAVGGRLIMPVGSSRYDQNLVLLTRTADGHYDERRLSPVAFVPLVGEEGW
jgi:protein-L-isoaspartate(D-aspartate) O-methyltransferase